MAKTSYSIQFDYRKAKAQADRLERMARELGRMADGDMSACMRNISHNWKGTYASAYEAKAWKIAETMRFIADDFKTTANVIRRIAGNKRNAEQNALEIARKREYGG